MKRIPLLLAFILLITALSLPGGQGKGGCGPIFGKLAYAQAGPDHDAILAALIGMKQDINQMIALVNRHKAAKVDVGAETVSLSAGQMTQILTSYNTLKASLVAKYQQLP